MSKIDGTCALQGSTAPQQRTAGSGSKPIQFQVSVAPRDGMGPGLPAIPPSALDPPSFSPLRQITPPPGVTDPGVIAALQALLAMA